MPPISSPTRRVLGDKDANASLNITSPRKHQQPNNNVRQTFSPRSQTKHRFGAANTISASPRVGQKRPITEVEGVETRDWEDVIKASQATDMVSDSASEADQMETSMLSTRSAADTTMTSFGIAGSQDDLVEQQFEMLEPEMSQRTLDKIHAVALPQNTSQPSQFRDRPSLVQNTSEDSVGMSNFLNFHSEPNSQASDGLNMIDTTLSSSKARHVEPESIQPVQKELSMEEQRKVMMEEKAAQLRTRLQLAFFKVETRQTNTPLSRLKVPESHRRKSQSPPSLPPPPMSFHRPQSHSLSVIPSDRTGLSPEARIAALRAQATMQRKSAVRALSSLPMPNIQPTAFSARWAEETPHTHVHSHPTSGQTPPQADGSNETASVQLPSSPPVSNHSLHIHEDDTATAARSRTQSSVEVNKSPMLPTAVLKSSPIEQLSSPPASQDEEEASVEELQRNIASDPTSHRETQRRERRLTGSAVKGEAASGLLQLMRGGVVNAENMRGPMCGL